MKEQFIQTIQSIVALPEAEKEKILKIMKPMKLNKGEHYLLQGQKPNNFAFVLKGLFRYFYTSESGNEFTKGFFPEGTFLASYSALIENRESFYGIDALEDSEILTINFEKWKDLLNGHRCWSTFLIAILEKGYCKKSRKRAGIFIVRRRKEIPEIFRRIPGFG